MKTIINTLVIILIALPSLAQKTIDVIQLKNDSLIKGNIIKEVIPDYILFKTLEANEIKISYLDIKKNWQQDEEEKMDSSKLDKNTSSMSAEDLYNKGSNDAKKYYRAPFSGTFITTALTNPVFGLIPAIGGSTTAPRERNLNYPDANLMKDKNYKEGYTKRAKKIKQGKIWTGFATGVAVYVAFISLYLSSQ